MTRSWLASIEAEAYAILHDKQACFNSLKKTDVFLERSGLQRSEDEVSFDAVHNEAERRKGRGMTENGDSRSCVLRQVESQARCPLCLAQHTNYGEEDKAVSPAPEHEWFP
jgi:hypothetical protein